MLISNKGLQNFGKSGKDFTFVLNNRKRYLCNRFQAYFISPKISRICLMNDASTDEYYVQVNDPNNQFSEIMKVMEGHSLSNNCDRNFLLELSKEFENPELVPHLKYHILSKENIGNSNKFIFEEDETGDYFCFFQDEELNIKNVFLRLKEKVFYGLNYEEEADFIASKFDEIEKNEFIAMNFDDVVISKILESSELRTIDEHQLFVFIHEYITQKQNEDKYSYLYSYVLFEYLDTTDILFFFANTKECYYLSGSIWYSLKQRLFCGVDPSSSPKRENSTRFSNYSNRKLFPYSTLNPFNGIFNYLWQINNSKNPAIDGLVSLSTNSPRAKKSSPVWSIIDPNFSDNEFFGIDHDGKEHEIVFDFKDSYVSVNGYTLKAHSSVFSQLNYFLVSWAIMGSLDGKSWEKIDEVIDEKDLKINLEVKHFECEKSKFFRYIKFRQIGECSGNYADNTYLLIQEIEFFGETKSAK